MKNKIIQSILLFVFSIFVMYGQKEIDKKIFNQMVNYCACEISHSYTKSYSENGKPENVAESVFTEEQEAFRNKISSKISNCDIDKSISQTELIELLVRNKYRTFATKLNTAIERVKSFYDTNKEEEFTELIIEGFYQDPNIKPIADKYSSVTNLKNILEIELKSFSDKILVSQNNPNTKPNNQKKKPEKLIDPKEESAFSLIWLVIILLPIICSVMLFYHFNQKIRELHKKLNSNELNSKQSCNDVSFKVDEFEGKLNTKIKELELKINTTISTKLEEFKQKQESKITSPIIPQVEKSLTYKKPELPVIPKAEEKIMYVSKPNKEGVFEESSFSNSEKTGKYYKFTLQNNSEANFEFLNTMESVSMALDSPEKFIELACHSKDALNQYAKKIITIEPGLAIKQGDGWIIKEKAEIRYE
ncbi:hypothetical protein [Kordia sp.]|uniref:hypothetical protein n=1 Tax=Kordia sp. TaxID=1965332 RepID=UPI003D28C97D